MLFLLLGLGVLAASAASWARLLSDPAFSDAILQAGLLTFWWSSLMVLVEQPGFLVSTPSIAVPLLVASLGPFVGLPVAAVGVLALWRRPKEIEVQGRAPRPARPAAFRPVKEDLPVRRAAPVERAHAAPPPSWERTASRDLPTPEEVEEAAGAPRRGGAGSAAARKAAGIGAAISELFVRLRRQAAEAAEQRTAKRAAQAERKASEAPRAPAEAPVAATPTQMEEQPLPERIMAWYAAWVTVRAGQRPPRMLEDARRLAAELDPQTRSAMTGYGMRGATALSMLESAAAAGVGRAPSDEEEGFLPPPRSGEEGLADPDEFMREVEAPEAYGEEASAQGPSAPAVASGPVLIEDDVAPPAPSAASVPHGDGQYEASGPMVIEDDIGAPMVDREAGSPAEELAARRVMGARGREEVEIPFEESEFLPAPGTVEPGPGGVATTETTGWDEVSVAAPSVPETSVAAYREAPIDEADADAFLAEAGAAAPEAASGEAYPEAVVEPAPASVSDMLAEERPVEGAEALVEQGWPPFGGPEEPVAGPRGTEEPAAPEAVEAGWPPFGGASDAEATLAEEPAPEAAGPEADRFLEEAAGAVEVSTERAEEASLEEARPSASAGAGGGDAPSEDVASFVPAGVPISAMVPEAAPVEEPSVEAEPETFPSGVAPEAQEAVIGPLLADPRRRATILGEREGTPAWTLRRLELHGLLGLSDKSNPAVVRMWEALDRLVAHQARVFAWETLKEAPPPAFETHEQRAAHVVDLAREVVAERGRVGPDLLDEIRRLKAGTEHVAWMDDRVDSLLAAMISPKVVEQLGDFLPKPEEGRAQAGGRLLKVMTGRRDPEPSAVVETPYEELLAASHEIHQRYKEICKGLMVPLYRSLSVKVKEADGRPAYAQVELVMGDVASVKQRSAAPEGAVGVVFVIVPPGRWQVAEAAGRAGQDRLVLEGVGENAGRLVRVRDRSLEIFHRWVEGRNMRPYGVVHLLCGEGTVVEGIDRRWGDVEFVRNPWGQKDLEAIQKSRLRPKAG